VRDKRSAMPVSSRTRNEFCSLVDPRHRKLPEDLVVPEMIYSKGSVVICQQRAHDGLAGGVVVPDRGCEGKKPLHDVNGDALRRVPAVPFQVKLALEDVVDRLDDLAQELEELRSAAVGLAFAGRAQELQPGSGGSGFEDPAEVVLVSDGDLARSGGGQGGIGSEHAKEGLAFIGLGMTIVLAALAISRWIESQTGWSIRKFVKTARCYHTIQI
jgi:hypothetical protein